MRTILLFASLLVITTSYLQAQVEEQFGSFATEWESHATASVIMADGSVIYGGGYGRWGYITQVNSSGKISWEQRVESEYGASCESVVIDEMGQSYALIQFRRAVKIANIEIDLNRFEDVTMLLKVKPEGNYKQGDYLIMEKVRAQKMTYHKNTGLVLTMVFRHGVKFIDGNDYKGQMDDILVANFSRQLLLKWVRHLQGNGDNSVAAMDIDNNGAIYLAGKGLNNISFTGEKLVYTSSGISGVFNYVAKLNSFGQVQWAHILNEDGAVDVSALKANNQGQLFLAGSYSGNFNYGGVKNVSSDKRAPFTHLLNASGQFAIHHLFGTSAHEAWITDLSISGSRIIATGNFFRNVAFGNTNLSTNEPEDAWRLQRNGFVAEWSPFQNQVNLTHYSSDNTINLTGVNAKKQQILVVGSLAGGLFINESKKYTPTTRSFSGFFHLTNKRSGDKDSTTDEVIIVADEETITELINQEETTDTLENNAKGEIVNVIPIKRRNKTFIVEKDNELVFVILDDFGDIVSIGGVHEDYGVIAFEDNSAEIKEGAKKQPLAIVNGETLIMTHYPDGPPDGPTGGETNDQKTPDSTENNQDKRPENVREIPRPNPPPVDENIKHNDALEYCLSKPNLKKWEICVCIAEAGIAEIHAIRDKHEKIQAEIGEKFRRKYKDFSLSEIPDEIANEFKQDFEETFKKSFLADSIKFAEFDEVRERYTGYLNSLKTLGIQVSIPISGSHFTSSPATINHFHWDKYTLLSGPVAVFHTGVGNFTRQNLSNIFNTCRSQSALEVELFDDKGLSNGKKYAFLIGESIQRRGVLSFGIYLLDHKKLKNIVQTDVYYRNSFPCDPQSAEKEQQEEAKESQNQLTPNFTPQHGFNRNRAIWLSIMAGINEFNKVTTEGFSVLGKIAWAKYTNDKSGLAVNTVKLITWAGANLADPYFELIGNRSEVMDYLKNNRQKIDFTLDAGELFYLGSQKRKPGEIIHPKLREKFTEFIMQYYPESIAE